MTSRAIFRLVIQIADAPFSPSCVRRDAREGKGEMSQRFAHLATLLRCRHISRAIVR